MQLSWFFEPLENNLLRKSRNAESYRHVVVTCTSTSTLHLFATRLRALREMKECRWERELEKVGLLSVLSRRHEAGGGLVELHTKWHAECKGRGCL